MKKYNDLYLAAFLSAKGIILKDMKQDDSGRWAFEFNDQAEVPELIKEFRFDPFVRAFVRSIKDLKYYLHNPRMIKMEDLDDEENQRRKRI